MAPYSTCRVVTVKTNFGPNNYSNPWCLRVIENVYGKLYSATLITYTHSLIATLAKISHVLKIKIYI